jgi:hypothetical protein
MISIRIAVGVGAIVAVISGGDAAVAADRSVTQLPASQRTVPIMVPIGCLMAGSCGSGLEGASTGSAVTIGDIGHGEISAAGRTSSDPRVYGVDEEATRAVASEYLAGVRGELKRLTRGELLSRGERPAGQGIIGPPPPRLQSRIDQYANGNEFFDCASVFVAMQQAAAEIADEKRRGEILWALYSHYIDSCYRGKLESLGSARNRIVILLRKSPGRSDYLLYCLGFNFAGNYVLTARHCLVEAREVTLMVGRYKPSDPDAFIEIDGPLSGTRALVLGEPGKLYPMRLPTALNQELKFFPFELEKDSFVLEIDAPERKGLSRFPVSTASQWDDIALAAIFPDEAVLSNALNSGAAAEVMRIVDGASAVDVSPLCSLVYSKKSTMPFVFHGCQTRYGYSGGPILRRGKGGAMTLVGVHNGSVDPGKPVDQWPYTAYFPNYGLRLPLEVRKLYGKP